MINVCYCVNSGVFNGLLLSILSMLNRTKERVNVIVLTMDLTFLNPNFLPLSTSQTNLLKRVISQKNGGSLIVFDVSTLYKTHFLGGKNERTGYTPYSMIRLFLDLLPVPEKIAYLDADVMFTGDIKTLFDQDISTVEFGACKDFMGKFWIDKNYCNSGVMLLNLAKIKESKLFEKCRKVVASKKMFMPDQTALNRLATSKKILPNKFNEQRNVKKDTVIKHFCKGIKWLPFFKIYNVKQWQRDKVKTFLKINCFDGDFAEFDKIICAK